MPKHPSNDVAKAQPGVSVTHPSPNLFPSHLWLWKNNTTDTTGSSRIARHPMSPLFTGEKIFGGNVAPLRGA
jgi:hypothetical protein